jgi:hypothetical protein
MDSQVTIIIPCLNVEDYIDDCQESPLVDLARCIVTEGRDLTIVNPHVNPESLRT